MLSHVTHTHTHTHTRTHISGEHGRKAAHVRVRVFWRECEGIEVAFCWCQLARGLQTNVGAYAQTHMCLVQTKGALTNNHKQISSSAETQRVKRECRFHRDGVGGRWWWGTVSLVLGCVSVCEGVCGACAAVECCDPSP